MRRKRESGEQNKEHQNFGQSQQDLDQGIGENQKSSNMDNQQQ
jgi:hypothetical protein